MIPKEKAELIINEMYKVTPCIPSDLGANGSPNLYAKQCALIAVDLLIESSGFEISSSYWRLVKEEINKL